MKAFSVLLESILLTPSRNQKLALMTQYFKEAPDPDRGYALAILTGEMSFNQVKPAFLKKIVLEKVDPVLFGMSYDYVGDLAETIALLWPETNDDDLPALSQIVDELQTLPVSQVQKKIMAYLSGGTATQRWALIKLVTGNLRVGVSARLAKTALANLGQKDIDDIEHIWHGLTAPYTDMFLWLDGKAEKPEIASFQTFHPLMLSHPIDEEKDFEKLAPQDFQAEWKWDGIRVQIVLDGMQKKMFSRTGDDISAAFPDLMDSLSGQGVLDGELLVGKDFEASPFNDLQQRLNRKTVSAKMMQDYPPFVRLYDILFDHHEDIRKLPLKERRKHLENWLQVNPNARLDISQILEFESWAQLGEIRARGAEDHGHEGIMVKRRDSIYTPGRPRGEWFKWKRDPRVVDAILMYAQRGHGKRSSFYSDYTFGLWKGNEIVPIGKAYFGFTDEELLQLDKWVRNHTTERFGPVRQVAMELVFEVAFDSAHESTRHRSGVALRFPRINRIRWDKPAQEADTLDNLQKLITA